MVLLAVALLLGRSFGHHIPALEDWIARQGIWGYLIFGAAVVLGTSLLVPDTMFAVAAGALFGVLGGTVVMTLCCLLTAVLNYFVARLLLRQYVQAWVARRPQLLAIQQAVNREGFRFQFLLRLTPVNPVTISYLLGATGVKFMPFLAACFGLVPALFVEVYFGYVAKHVAKVAGRNSEHSPLHTTLTIVGLVACIGVLVYVVRLAHRAIQVAQAHSNPPATPS